MLATHLSITTRVLNGFLDMQLVNVTVHPVGLRNGG